MPLPGYSSLTVRKKTYDAVREASEKLGISPDKALAINIHIAYKHGLVNQGQDPNYIKDFDIITDNVSWRWDTVEYKEREIKRKNLRDFIQKSIELFDYSMDPDAHLQEIDSLVSWYEAKVLAFGKK